MACVTPYPGQRVTLHPAHYLPGLTRRPAQTLATIVAVGAAGRCLVRDDAQRMHYGVLYWRAAVDTAPQHGGFCVDATPGARPAPAAWFRLEGGRWVQADPEQWGQPGTVQLFTQRASDEMARIGAEVLAGPVKTEAETMRSTIASFERALLRQLAVSRALREDADRMAADLDAANGMLRMLTFRGLDAEQRLIPSAELHEGLRRALQHVAKVRP